MREALARKPGENAPKRCKRASPIWRRRRSTRRGRCGSSISRRPRRRAERNDRRIHHCIGDGIALISVTLSIADGGQPSARRQIAAESETTGLPAVIRPLALAQTVALPRSARA